MPTEEAPRDYSVNSTRFWAKKLADKLANSNFQFVMMIEDSIFGWKGKKSERKIYIIHKDYSRLSSIIQNV
jgi:hypothetical protein